VSSSSAVGFCPSAQRSVRRWPASRRTSTARRSRSAITR
jgi:hypothetical protein